MVTRPVMASRARAIRLNWRIVVIVSSECRHTKSATMSTIGFCRPSVAGVCKIPNGTTKASFVRPQFWRRYWLNVMHSVDRPPGCCDAQGHTHVLSSDDEFVDQARVVCGPYSLVPTENIAARLAIQQAQLIVLPRSNAAPDQSMSVVN